jgi:hypothetical protein
VTTPNPCPACGVPLLYVACGCDANGHPTGPRSYKYSCRHVAQKLGYPSRDKAAQAWNECVGGAK